jgi:phenylalanyl-tRNA synthetase beta chain
MLVPYSWLRDFAPFDLDPVELGRALDDLGMVVEHTERVGEGLEAVVVARVLETRPHPDADKVQLVDVDAGDGEALQVVCGAFNFSAGDLVPLAPIGAALPNGMEIARRKVRGEWSNGMLCASDELGLGEDHSGIMVLSVSAEPGTRLIDALGLQPDVVYDLDITANRPDAMSMAGVARDLAARLKVPFTLPEPVVAEGEVTVADLTSVVIEAPDLCPRFTARVIQGVTIGPSPDWMQGRLTLAGMRPINNVVDASNYVMLELGQPTHPYDRDRLPGHGFVVRRARSGEIVQTLDKVDRTVGDGDDCLICDAEGSPVGIGGIMGGGSSEIDENTHDVVLEAAYFTPMVIARTSKRINLRTEASARFERGVDPEGIERASARFCELVGSGQTAKGILDVRPVPAEPRVVRTRVAKVNGLLGTSLGQGEIMGLIEPIGFTSTEVEPGVVDVTVPSWRPDVAIEVDVTEEVGRHYGYANIPKTVPSSPRAGGLSPYQQMRRLVREVMVGLGLDEAMNSPLVGPEDHAKAGVDGPVVEAANPMMREESVLRRCLLPGLLRNLAFNASHRNPAVGLFEVGNVFLPPPDGQQLPDEREYIAAAMAGEDATVAVAVWRTVADALRLDAPRLVEGGGPGLHPGRTAVAWAGDVKLGVVGEVDPWVLEGWGLEGRVAWVELDMGRLATAPRRSDELRPVSRYPSSDIDLAFTVPDDVPAGAVERTLRETGGELLEELRLFDVYRGEGIDAGNRSLAFRLRFCAQDRTLTDAEVGETRARAIEAVESAHGAHLRG